MDGGIENWSFFPLPNIPVRTPGLETSRIPSVVDFSGLLSKGSGRGPCVPFLAGTGFRPRAKNVETAIPQ